MGLAVHCPELFANDHLLNLASEDQSYGLEVYFRTSADHCYYQTAERLFLQQVRPGTNRKCRRGGVKGL